MQQQREGQLPDSPWLGHDPQPSLLLDARASIEMAPRVAEVMAGELGHDMDWQQAQVAAYTELARKYLMVP